MLALARERERERESILIFTIITVIRIDLFQGLVQAVCTFIFIFRYTVQEIPSAKQQTNKQTTTTTKG